jgi:hypothetical protein
MNSVNNQPAKTPGVNSTPSLIPTDILLSLSVAPLLLGVVATDAVSSWLQSVGLSSEEVFRGERLPVLHFPDSGSLD